MRRIGAAIIAIGAIGVGLGACASAEPTDAPEWYREAARSSGDGYPSLAVTPHAPATVADQAHWAAVEADLLAAREEMRANPRSEPAPPQDPGVFLDEAREDIEQTRDSH